ncbi:hypothetical protein BGY98DRAFT_121299 [Russula aff. rugulosa BPL654]|nr:hypothetical protein BGY98DRAFT_121299 [Russula aff. rugulosa BPL654]
MTSTTTTTSKLWIRVHVTCWRWHRALSTRICCRPLHPPCHLQHPLLLVCCHRKHSIKRNTIISCFKKSPCTAEVSRERTRAPLQEILAFGYSQTIHAAAIGHYIAAILTDPSEPTFFLNRAAAYLKLSKNEDAESDCTTVLGLSNKNVKALFLRVQARTALQKLGEAHNTVKAELAHMDAPIVNRKGKTQRSAPIDVSASSPPPTPPSSPTVPAKRRCRVPITIVDDDHPPISTHYHPAQQVIIMISY